MVRKWFGEKDRMSTVKAHISGTHTPDSIREAAKEEYRRRRTEEGASKSEIDSELFELEN